MNLAAESICIGYRSPVLREVSASFAAGRIGLVLGPNGSGKTTLLRGLLGLIEPEAGMCTLGGEPVRRMSAARRAERLAYVPHQPRVEYSYTARQYVGFGHAGRSASRAVVERALERLELTELADAPMAELSAGQAQRASIARALAQVWGSEAAGRFLVADEPTSALDPRHVSGVLSLFRSLTAEGVGVVMTMHDLTSACEGADDVCVLGADGRVAAAGERDAVLRAEVLERVFETGFSVIEHDGMRVVVRRESVTEMIEMR